MDQPASPRCTAAAVLPLPRWEFIALAAALMALNALAIDIMLPGAAADRRQPRRRRTRTTANTSSPPTSPASALAQLAWARSRTGSAAAGRCSSGSSIYVAAALRPRFAPTFGVLLALRFVQGDRRGVDARHRRLGGPRRVRRPRHGRDHVAGLHGVHGHPGHRAGRRAGGDAVRRLAHDLRLHGGRRPWRSRSGPRLRLPETLHPEYRRRLHACARCWAASASCSPTASRSATRSPRRSSSARCSASSIRPSRSMSASTGSGSGSRSSSPQWPA